MSFRVTKNTIAGGLQRIRQRFPRETAAALYDEIKDDEFPETQQRVPVKEGDLKATGRVTEPEVHGNTVTVRIAYGGQAPNGREVDYAVYVHEDMEADHPNGGQAKFVSSVLNESAPYMANRLAVRMHFERWAS